MRYSAYRVEGIITQLEIVRLQKTENKLGLCISEA
jgi:hypothetical protein